MKLQSALLVLIAAAGGWAWVRPGHKRTALILAWLGVWVLGYLHFGHRFLDRNLGFGNIAHCEVLPGYQLLFPSTPDRGMLRSYGVVVAFPVRSLRVGDRWIAGMTQEDGEASRYFYVDAASGTVSDRRVEGLEAAWTVYEHSQRWRWWDLWFVVVAVAGSVVVWRWS